MATAGTDYLSKGVEVVRGAENGLRTLLSEAALAGDFEAVMTLGVWAKEIKNLADGLTKAPAPGSPRAAATRGTSEGYPKFFRNENRLVMIGWSKKTNTEYEHRAPKAVLDQLVPLLLSGTKNGEPMHMDKILQGLKPENGGVYPEYYARTFLRWLRMLGLVTKHGHQGYTVRNREGFEATVYNNWKRLAIK
jgi:hypothetical protein